MADETQNVVLDFKMNGQVQFANTLKDINAVMNTATKEYRAQISSMDENASSTQKLAAEQQKLQIQSEAAAKRTQILSEQLKTMQDRGETSGSSFDRLVGKVADAQRVENNLKGALDQVNSQLSEQGSKANDAKDHISNLQQEEGELDSKLRLASSSAKLENAQLGDNASESQKTAAAQRQLSEQMDLSRQKVDNLKQQLKETVTAYGENSSEATQMKVKLNDAETSVANLGNQMDKLGKESQDTSSKLDEIAKNTAAERLQTVSNGFQSAGQGLQNFNQKAQEAWAQTDDAVDNLTSKTGAVGGVADKLGESFEKVERSESGAQMESMDLSNTMAGLTSQFNLSGPQLEKTSEDVAKFSQITGQSGTDAVNALHDSMSRFNLSAKDIPSVLDAFAAASQRTGVPVADLEEDASKAYPAFKQLHISLQQGIPLLASWSKSGIDSSTVLKGMQKAFSAAKTENKSFSDVMTESFKGIKDAKTDQDAFNIAIQTFGAKSGPQMAQAIRDGKVSLDGLKKSAQDTGGTVSKSFKQTLDPVDKAKQAQKEYEQTMGKIGGTIQETLLPVIKRLLPIVKGVSDAFNKAPAPVKALVVEFGAITVALGVLAPVITAVATVLPMIGVGATAAGTGAGLGAAGMGAFMATLLPIVGVIAAVIAAITAVVLVIKNWGAIVTWLKGVWSTVASFFSGMWTSIKQIFTVAINGITNFLKPAFTVAVNVIKSIWNGIKSFFSALWNGIKVIFTVAITAIAVIIGTYLNIWKTIITTAMNLIKGIITNVWNGIKSFFGPILASIGNVIRSAWNSISSVTSSVFNKVKSVVSSIWNNIKNVVSNVVNAVKSVVSNAWNAVSSTTSNIFNGVKSAVSNVWNSIKSTISNVVGSIRNAVSSAWNAVSSVTSNVWNSIKNAISGPINTAKDIVRGAIDAIRGFFNFSIHWPHIPMPHFSIQPSGWSVGDLLHGSIPHLGIDWYAQGGIMTQPTMFANNNGRAQVGGEAGPEGVIPLNDDTWNKMGAAIAAHMPSQGPITLQVDGRTFATITGPYTSDYLKQQDATQNFSYGRRL